MAKEKIEKVIETNLSLKFLKSYVGKYGHFSAGKVYQVDSAVAQDFIKSGDAVEDVK